VLVNRGINGGCVLENHGSHCLERLRYVGPGDNGPDARMLGFIGFFGYYR
jgi:hypothetical protein